jgi:hypothetical protein
LADEIYWAVFKISGLDSDIYETNNWPQLTTQALARGTTRVANSDNRLRLVSDSNARLRSIIATLEESRADLVESANSEAAQILAMAILQLRMRLHGVAASELDVLCAGVLLQEAERSRKSAGLNDGSLPGCGSRRPHSIK